MAGSAQRPEPRVRPPPLAAGSLVRVVAPAGPVDRLAAGLEVLPPGDCGSSSASTCWPGTTRCPISLGRMCSAPATSRPPGPTRRSPRSGRPGVATGASGCWTRSTAPQIRAAGPKHLIGFSDLTALHGRLGRRLGQVTIHGPGVASVGQLPDVATAESLQRLLLRPPVPGAVLASGQTLVPGSVAGRVWAGNLRVLATPGRLAGPRTRGPGRRRRTGVSGSRGASRRPRHPDRGRCPGRARATVTSPCRLVPTYGWTPSIRPAR